jgi:hypothetical protein
MPAQAHERRHLDPDRRSRSSKHPGSGSRSRISGAMRGSPLTRPGSSQTFPPLARGTRSPRRRRRSCLPGRRGRAARTSASRWSRGHRVRGRWWPRIHDPCPGTTGGSTAVADFHREHFAALCGRRQGLAREAPGLGKLLAGHDEAILDPLDTRCLSARSGTCEAAGGLGQVGSSIALSAGAARPRCRAGVCRPCLLTAERRLPRSALRRPTVASSRASLRSRTGVLRSELIGPF